MAMMQNGMEYNYNDYSSFHYTQKSNQNLDLLIELMKNW